jgi:hypothetical protein
MKYVTPRNVTIGSTTRNGVFRAIRADIYVMQQ